MIVALSQPDPLGSLGTFNAWAAFDLISRTEMIIYKTEVILRGPKKEERQSISMQKIAFLYYYANCSLITESFPPIPHRERKKNAAEKPTRYYGEI